MMYASSLNHFVKMSQVTKVKKSVTFRPFFLKNFELQDPDDLTEDWLKHQMLTKGFC